MNIPRTSVHSFLVQPATSRSSRSFALARRAAQQLPRMTIIRRAATLCIASLSTATDVNTAIATPKRVDELLVLLRSVDEITRRAAARALGNIAIRDENKSTFNG